MKTKTITMTVEELAKHIESAQAFYFALDKFDGGCRFEAYREALCDVLGSEFVAEANALAMKNFRTK